MKEKEIRDTDLQPDTGNYRPGKQADQREAIRALIEERKAKLVRLAQDIMENGLSPLERIMVAPIAGEKNRYSDVEGKRRGAAIRPLHRPDLAAGAAWHNAFKRPRKGVLGQVPKKLPCTVVASKEEGLDYSAVSNKNEVHF